MVAIGIGMAVTMVCLDTSLSRWRLASSAHGNDKEAHLKAIMGYCMMHISVQFLGVAEFCRLRDSILRSETISTYWGKH